jgi:hypothetical protein
MIMGLRILGFLMLAGFFVAWCYVCGLRLERVDWNPVLVGMSGTLGITGFIFLCVWLMSGCDWNGTRSNSK